MYVLLYFTKLKLKPPILCCYRRRSTINTECSTTLGVRSTIVLWVTIIILILNTHTRMWNEKKNTAVSHNHTNTSTQHTPSGSNAENLGRRHSWLDFSLSCLRPDFSALSLVAKQLVIFTNVLVDVALMPPRAPDDLASFSRSARAKLASKPRLVVFRCLTHNTSSHAVVSKAEQEGVLTGPFLLETVRHDELHSVQVVDRKGGFSIVFTQRTQACFSKYWNFLLY